MLWLLEMVAWPTHAHVSPEEMGSAPPAKGLLPVMGKTDGWALSVHTVWEGECSVC